MKTILRFLPSFPLAMLVFAMLVPLKSKAQSCEVALRNDTLASNNHIFVDVYVKATSGPFHYSAGQYKVIFNPAIKDTSLHVYLVPGYSDLTNPIQYPTVVWQPTPASSRFEIIGGEFPMEQSFCSIISETGIGTRICRVDITRSTPFPAVQANLQVTTTPPTGTAVFYMTPFPQSYLCTMTMNNTALVNPVLNQPINTTYTLTGGSYCSGGANIFLSGSETGVSYKLMKDGTGLDPILAGNGTPLTWTGQTEGNYAVYAWRTAAYINGTFGSATVTYNPVTLGGSITPSYNILGIGSGTGVMTITGHTGAIVKWQKQFNDGGFTDIPVTTTTYAEVPGPEGIYNYRCEVQNAPCPPVYSDFNTITVTGTPVTTAATMNACPGNIIMVPVTVNLFNAITAMSLRMDYDPTFMTFGGYTNTNPALAGLVVNDLPATTPPLRKIVMVWNDVNPKTLPDDSKLADLKFSCISGTPALTFNNTDNAGHDCEYADSNGNPIPDSPGSTYYHNSTIYIGPADAGPITGPSSVCHGASGVAYSVAPINNATGYTWSLPAGATISSGANTSSITVDYPPTATSGSIMVAGTNACPAMGDVSILDVTVGSLPVPTITGPDTVCGSPLPGRLFATEAGMTGYTWTLSAGGSISSGSGTNIITANWDSAGPGWVRVSYLNSMGCTPMQPAQFNIFVRKLPPTPDTISGPHHVLQGQTGVSYHIAPVPGATGYVWNVHPGWVTIVSGQGTDSITVDFSPNAHSDFIWVYSTNQCGNSLSYSRIIAWVGYSAGGKFAYHNQSKATMPLDTVKLILFKDDIPLDTTFTDATGTYRFEEVPPGDYTIQAFTQRSWNGITSTDALLVERHFAGIELLTEPVSLDAADVNMSNSINGTDALKIKRRFVGLDNSFAHGDWTFAIQGAGGTHFTVTPTDTIWDFYGMCVGDVNGSYTPSGNKEPDNKVDLVSEGLISVQPGQYFELPVRVRTNMTVNAISLAIPFPGDLFDLTGVEMSQGTPVWNITNGQLRIAWSDLDGLDLKAGETMLTLKLRAKENIPVNTVTELHAAWESELGDDHGKVIPMAELTCPAIKILNAIGINDRNSGNENISVYPNPANDILNVEFLLESQAECSFLLSDVTGRIVKIIPEKRFETGKGKLQISISDLTNGLYNLKVKIDYKNGSFEYLRKVIINR